MRNDEPMWKVIFLSLVSVISVEILPLIETIDIFSRVIFQVLIGSLTVVYMLFKILNEYGKKDNRSNDFQKSEINKKKR